MNWNPGDEEEMCVVADDTTVDEALSVEEKQDVYKMCAKVAREKLVKHGASMWDIEDIAGGMYARLLLLSQRAILWGRGFLMINV